MSSTCVGPDLKATRMHGACMQHETKAHRKGIAPKTNCSNIAKPSSTPTVSPPTHANKAAIPGGLGGGQGPWHSKPLFSLVL